MLQSNDASTDKKMQGKEMERSFKLSLSEFHH